MLSKITVKVVLFVSLYLGAVLLGSFCWNVFAMLPTIGAATLNMVVASKQTHLITVFAIVIMVSAYYYIKGNRSSK